MKLCSECGKPIPPERLRWPNVETCSRECGMERNRKSMRGVLGKLRRKRHQKQQASRSTPYLMAIERLYEWTLKWGLNFREQMRKAVASWATEERGRQQARYLNGKLN